MNSTRINQMNDAGLNREPLDYYISKFGYIVCWNAQRFGTIKWDIIKTSVFRQLFAHLAREHRCQLRRGLRNPDIGMS